LNALCERNAGVFIIKAGGTYSRSCVISLFFKRYSLKLGPKRGGVTGGWRKLHNEELHNLYSSPSVIRMIKSRGVTWERNVARMGEKRILVGKPERKRPIGRLRRR
jgi:hypothetical protein